MSRAAQCSNSGGGLGVSSGCFFVWYTHALHIFFFTNLIIQTNIQPTEMTKTVGITHQNQKHTQNETQKNQRTCKPNIEGRGGEKACIKTVQDI